MKILFASGSNAAADPWISLLQQALPHAEIIPWSDDAPRTGAELAVVWRPSPELLLRETGIRALFNMGAGVDGLLDLPGLHQGVSIYRLEDAGMAVQMAEYAVHALLDVSRRFAEYRRYQAQGVWKQRAPVKREQWPVGVLGLGLMGQRVATTIAALEYPVAGWSRNPKEIPHVDCYAGEDGFEAFLERTRVLINILPLTPQTTGILNRSNLSRLLPRAHVINVARGPHLVEQDLLDLIEQGHIESATLDVFSEEPLPSDHAFWKHPAITITPHVAASSIRELTVNQIAQKIQAYERGELITGDVALDQGY